MTWWQAVILGLLQGLTEFLPVSSSGHLVLAQHILGLELTPDVTFEVFLHAGTAFSILTVYRRQIWSMIAHSISGFVNPIRGYQTDSDVRITWLVIIASIPAGLAYVFLDTKLEWTYARPWFACIMLIITGLLLLSTLLARSQDGHVTVWKSCLIGLAQATALLPGVSRSGATISIALLSGVKPKSAADFSFIMVLPVIFGATLIKLIELIQSPETIDWFPVIIATLLAYGTGVCAIKMVLRFVRQGQLHIFSIYCVGVGGLALLFL